MERHTAAIAACTIALLAFSAQAQTVYRSVGPDGRVSYTDRPPASGPASAQPGGAAPESGGLPYALRQARTRFPVTLYTSTACPPCDDARAMLHARGIPFDERTVQSAADADAFKRLFNETRMPLATIGAQRLMGYEPEQWRDYLNAAGYPPKSQLPPGYQRPAAAPLAPAQPATASTAPPAPAPTAAPPAPARGPSATNPAGIIF